MISLRIERDGGRVRSSVNAACTRIRANAPGDIEDGAASRDRFAYAREEVKVVGPIPRRPHLWCFEERTAYGGRSCATAQPGSWTGGRRPLRQHILLGKTYEPMALYGVRHCGPMALVTRGWPLLVQ